MFFGPYSSCSRLQGSVCCRALDKVVHTVEIDRRFTPRLVRNRYSRMIVPERGRRNARRTQNSRCWSPETGRLGSRSLRKLEAGVCTFRQGCSALWQLSLLDGFMGRGVGGEEEREAQYCFHARIMPPDV